MHLMRAGFKSTMKIQPCVLRQSRGSSGEGIWIIKLKTEDADVKDRRVFEVEKFSPVPAKVNKMIIGCGVLLTFEKVHFWTRSSCFACPFCACRLCTAMPAKLVVENADVKDWCNFLLLDFNAPFTWMRTLTGSRRTPRR